MNLTSSLVSILDGSDSTVNKTTFCPNLIAAFSFRPGSEPMRYLVWGIFLPALFIHAPALPAKEKPEQKKD